MAPALSQPSLEENETLGPDQLRPDQDLDILWRFTVEAVTNILGGFR